MVGELLTLVRGLSRGPVPSPDLGEPLAPATVAPATGAAVIRVDTRPLAGAGGRIIELAYGEHSRVDGLLDGIYFAISKYVGPYRYTEQWLLRDRASGQIFTEIGTKWAMGQGQRSDDRALWDIGMDPGSLLEVIPGPLPRYRPPRPTPPQAGPASPPPPGGSGTALVAEAQTKPPAGAKTETI